MTERDPPPAVPLSEVTPFVVGVDGGGPGFSWLLGRAPWFGGEIPAAVR